jgi:alanine racemase
LRFVPINPYVTVHVDLDRIRANVRAIAQRTKIPILAVIKAQAYGLGSAQIAKAIAPLVEGFCVFQLQEAIEIDLYRSTGKRALALGPPSTMDSHEFLRHGVTPSVSSADQAVLLRAAHPAVCVDTGMQRFGCAPENLESVIRAGDCKEAFTHGTRVEHALKLKELCHGREMKLHAAATSLLDRPDAYLDAVRPGWAMYRGAVRVSTTLVEAHDGKGPAGYTGFDVPRFGVILMGYSHGLRPGICGVNGQRHRVIEVGMQSAFVEIGASDRVGDPVVLLDETIDEKSISEIWGTTPQEALFQLCRAGRHEYVGE